MFRMLRLTALTKTEADAIADNAGLTRRERQDRFGWNYTALSFNGEPCGEITPQKTGVPFTMEVDLDQVDSTVRFRLCS